MSKFRRYDDTSLYNLGRESTENAALFFPITEKYRFAKYFY